MPTAILYPSVAPIIFGEEVRYTLTEKNLQEIFGKKNFAYKVSLLGEARNIAKLISVIQVFECDIAQIVRILKRKNDAAIGITHALSKHGPQLRRYGFTAANISSMLCGTTKSAPMIIAKVTLHAPELIRLGYSPRNISSMLCGAADSTPGAISTILEFTPQLIYLKYSPQNISSMLNSAGSFIPFVISVILETTPQLIDLGYSSKNISSIFHVSSSHARNVADAIFEHTPQLIRLGYSATNISSIVGGTGSSIHMAISTILEYTQPLLDLGMSHNNISGYLFHTPCIKYAACIEEIFILSSRVKDLGYSKSNLRQLFYGRAPSCRGAINLMQSIIDTHNAFSAFPAQTPSHLVEMATYEGQDFDVNFFTTYLRITREMHRSSSVICSARQARAGKVSHVEMLSGAHLMHKDRGDSSQR